MMGSIVMKNSHLKQSILLTTLILGAGSKFMAKNIKFYKNPNILWRGLSFAEKTPVFTILDEAFKYIMAISVYTAKKDNKWNNVISPKNIPICDVIGKYDVT